MPPVTEAESFQLLVADGISFLPRASMMEPPNMVFTVPSANPLPELLSGVTAIWYASAAGMSPDAATARAEPLVET